MNFTDNILAQYKVTMKGEKELLRFLDAADRKAKALQKTLSNLKIPRGVGFGGFGGGGRGGSGGWSGMRLGSLGNIGRGRGLSLGLDSIGSLTGMLGNGLSGLAGIAPGSLFSTIAGGAIAGAGAVAALTTAVVGLGMAWVAGTKATADWAMEMSRAGGQLEAMELRIQSVSTEFDASPWMKLQAGKEKYDELYKIAKMPGINMDDASTAFTTLKFNELGEELAMRLTKGFGNFNAFIGGGQDEFGRIIYALQNIASSEGKGLSGQDLRQLVNANVPIYRIMKDAFGTADAKEFNEAGLTVEQFFEKVTEWLETKVPKAADAALNAWDNVEQAIERAKGSGGKGLNKGGAADLINKATGALDQLVDSGVLESFGASIAAIFADLQDADLADLLKEIGSYAIIAAGGLKGLGDGLGFVLDLLTKLSPIRMMIEAFGGDRDKIKAGWEEEERLKEEAKKSLDRQRARHGGKTIAELAEEHRLNGLGRDKPKEEASRLEQIAEALDYQTRKSSKGYDMRRMMMGGDDLARMGVTPVELGVSAHENHRYTIEYRGDSAFRAMVLDIVGQLLGQGMGRGAFSPARG